MEVKLSFIHDTTLVNRYVFYFSDGVKLSPLGTAATVWPIVPAPNDRS
jgi:hypothetical protein